jgi:hypothetical protein
MMRSPLTRFTQGLAVGLLFCLVVVVLDLQQGKKTPLSIWWVAIGGSALTGAVILWDDVLKHESRTPKKVLKQPPPQPLSKVLKQPPQSAMHLPDAKDFHTPSAIEEGQSTSVFNPPFPASVQPMDAEADAWDDASDEDLEGFDFVPNWRRSA